MLVATLLIGFLACKKEEPGTYTGPLPIDYTVLPPETQTGAGTFGCLVDGEVWVPRVPLGAITYRDIESTVWEKDFTGSGVILCNLVDVSESIDNELVLSFGNTHFNSTKLFSVSIFGRYKTSTGEYFRSDYHYTNSNFIDITKIDTLNNIVSGIFNLTLYRDSTNLGDKIEISDGRFDLKYAQQ